MEINEFIENQKQTSFEERLNKYYKRHTVKDRLSKSDKYLESLSKERLFDKEDILRSLNLKNLVFGQISKRLQVGFLVKISKEEAFLPFSQFSLFPLLVPFENLNKLIGSFSEFEIIKVCAEPFMIILSRSSLQLHPDRNIIKQNILVNEITQKFEAYLGSIEKSREMALSVIETVEDKFYDAIYPDLSEEELKSILSPNLSDPFGNIKDNDYYESGPYCSACQQAPCMCSDPERTSTTWDF